MNTTINKPNILLYGPKSYHDLVSDLKCFNFIIKSHGSDLNIVLGSSLISCVIMVYPENVNTDLLFMKQKYSKIPFLVILEVKNIEAAWLCGKMGINKILEKRELSSSDLKNHISMLIKDVHIQVSMSEVDVDIESTNYPVKNALTFMEKNYVELKSVNEIAIYVGLSDSTLIREFQRQGLSSPKKLLLFLKMRHAIRLMQFKQLKIKEIAFLSGFTCVKRFNECFQRIYLCSPSSYFIN